MGNIVDYVKETSNITFRMEEFNTEDALVLSEFCYLKFDNLVGGMESEPITLGELDSFETKESLFSVKAYEKDNRKLYNAVLGSRRFSDMKIGYYVNQIDAESESQFAAVTFILQTGITVIAFRGTDETMAGWQEDFNLALKKPIIGQTLSAKYVNDVSEKIGKPFIICGHSKGGNLAMYSAMCANDEAQDRIIDIYSFDGPGFRPEFLENTDYEEIKSRIHRFMPKSSPVGLIFNAPGEYEIVEAKSVGVLQHNPYNWVIKNQKLVYTKMTEQHLLAAKSSNEWLLSLDDEGIENFVSMLCWILDATNASTTEEFKADMAAHTKALFKAGNEADEKYKEMASAFVRSYFELAGEMVKEEVRTKADTFFAELKGNMSDLKTTVTENKTTMPELINSINEIKDKFKKTP